MPSIKRDLLASTSLLALSLVVNAGFNESSILSERPSAINIALRSLINSFSFLRSKDEIISYKNDDDSIKLHLRANEENHTIEKVFIQNLKTKVNYMYLEGASYPTGYYKVSIQPQDHNLYSETFLNGDFSKGGNHIIRYTLKAKKQKLASNASKSETTGFNFNIDKLQENNIDIDSFNLTHKNEPQIQQKWLSGKIFLNTTPRNAHIEFLSPKNAHYVPGMTLENRAIKVKVSARDHIYTIKEFRLSQGKNIFVVPLRREIK